MKALLCTHYGPPDALALADIAEPTAGAGQAVVRVRAAALNFFEKKGVNTAIGLDEAGTVTITFSQAVQDPLLALVSWNGNTVDFGVPINILSYGAGYWGNGVPVLNSTGTGFFGSGEVHGVIELPGLYDSITFTHTSEGWHGFTVGAKAVVIPVPPTVWFLGSGLVGLIGLRSLRRK